MSLTLLGLLGVLVWWWVASLRAREAALTACRRACAREGVQLLDETIALHGLGLARDRDGRLRVRRTYAFEFSLGGDDRRRGEAVCLGRTAALVRGDWPHVDSAGNKEAETPLPGRVVPFRGRDGTPRH